MKLRNQALSICTASLLIGCGSPDYGMTEAQLAKSVEGFNKYCNSTSAEEWDSVPQNEEGWSTVHVLGNPEGSYKVAGPISSYDDLADAGHDSIWCALETEEAAVNFSLPNLSHLNPEISIWTEKAEALRTIPSGSTIRFLHVFGPEIDSYANLSQLKFEADHVSSYSHAHVAIDREGWNIELPDQWNLDISGSDPFTIRLGSTIKGYGGLEDLEEARIVVVKPKILSSADRMAMASPFCENYGDDTGVFLDDAPIGEVSEPDQWKPIPKAYVCDDGVKRPSTSALASS